MNSSWDVSGWSSLNATAQWGYYQSGNSLSSWNSLYNGINSYTTSSMMGIGGGGYTGFGSSAFNSGVPSFGYWASSVGSLQSNILERVGTGLSNNLLKFGSPQSSYFLNRNRSRGVENEEIRKKNRSIVEMTRLKEIARMREALVDFFAGSNEFKSTDVI